MFRALFSSVAYSLMHTNTNSINVQGHDYFVNHVGKGGSLRSVRFKVGNKYYRAIEQNPEKPSRWGMFARHGSEVVQIIDDDTNRYVCVVVDGRVQEYHS